MDAPGLAGAAVLALGLLAARGAAAAESFAARCEAAAQASPAAASFSSHANGWRIDNSLSYRALTGMKHPPVRHGYVLGLTHTESRVTVQIDGSVADDPASGRECVVPRIAVVLAYAPIVVYVGREFRPGSCAYREILAHEMRHLKSYLDTLPKVEAGLRGRLAGRVAGRPVVGNAGQARALLQREIDSQWLPLIHAQMQGVEGLQAAIDSPQEYARLSKVCHGEVQSLIGSTRTARPPSGPPSGPSSRSPHNTRTS